MFKVNEYFDGKVKSHRFREPGRPGHDRRHGSRRIRVRHRDAGDHAGHQRQADGQAAREKDLEILRPGKTFAVPAKKKFQLKVAEESAYLCLYK